MREEFRQIAGPGSWFQLYVSSRDEITLDRVGRKTPGFGAAGPRFSLDPDNSHPSKRPSGGAVVGARRRRDDRRPGSGVLPGSSITADNGRGFAGRADVAGAGPAASRSDPVPGRAGRGREGIPRGRFRSPRRKRPLRSSPDICYRLTRRIDARRAGGRIRKRTVLSNRSFQQ